MSRLRFAEIERRKMQHMEAMTPLSPSLTRRDRLLLKNPRRAVQIQ